MTDRPPATAGENVYILGVSMTPFGKLTTMSTKDIARQTVREVLADAGCETGDIDAVFYANATQGALEGQQMIRGQVALRPLGFESVPLINVENACASGATAFNLAHQAIRAGEAEIALAIGIEKMVMPDRAATMAAFGGALDVSQGAAALGDLLAMSDGFDLPPEALADTGLRSPFMDVYAAMARAHMQRFGTTPRQIAAVAAKNHAHSVENDKAQFRQSFTIDEVLASRMVSWPLTLPMCSPVSDGGAAAILCTERMIRKLGRAGAVRVEASVLASGSSRKAGDFESHIGRVAATKAYERAGIGPRDISLAEVHDATAFGELIQSEVLGFCPIGEGGPLAESGATRIGGRIPINPSGGLESKGHPVGATGLGQVYELVMQLRGKAGARQVEGARFALAENGGGMLGIEEAAASVIILGKTG